MVRAEQVTLVLMSLSFNLIVVRGELEIKPTDLLDLNITTNPSLLEDILHNNELGDWVAPPYIRKKIPYYVSGYDYEGRAIIVYEYGKYNYKEVLAKGENVTRDLTRYIDQAIWMVLKYANDTVEDGTGEVVLIYDFDGFALDNVNSLDGKGCHDFDIAVVTRFSLNMLSKFGIAYEKVGYGFLINVNFLAASFLNIARPFLSQFLDRFEQYGPKKEHWQPKLLRKLPRNQLPPWYGGEDNYKPVAVFG